MKSKFTPLVQQLIRAVEQVKEFASNHRGLPEDECEAVLFYVHELLDDIEKHCVERDHKHDSLAKRIA